MSDERLDEAIRAYEVPAPPAGLADRVAREVLERSARPAPRRRTLLLVAAAVAVVALVALARLPERVVAGERAPAALETIRLGRRAILVAGAGSELRWSSGARGALTIVQSRGDVFYRVDVGPFIVETPQGSVHVRGTCFRVEVPDMKLNRQAFGGAALGAAAATAVLVTVYEGRVSLARGDANAVEVAAGQAGALKAAEPPGLSAETSPTGSPAAPTPAAPTTLAVRARELEALRARVAEQEKELARLRQQPGPSPDKVANMIDPSREELLARASRCEIDYSYPNFDDPEPVKVRGRQATALGLSDTEREAADEALEELHEEVPAALRKIYADVSGDAATAARLSPSTVLTEILQKAPAGAVQQARTQLAQERAGLVPPPRDPTAASGAERALRVMVTLGDEFERRLATRVGADRARALQKLRDGWGSTSSMSGCRGK